MASSERKDLQPPKHQRAKFDYNEAVIIEIAMDDKELSNQRLYMSLVASYLTLSLDALKKNLQTNPALIHQLNAAGRYCYSTKDSATAKAYFEKAKELGSGYAYFCLGYIYQHAIPPEEKRALEAYNEAAKLNEPKAWNNLGVMYYLSKDKKHDATKYFLKAAELHVPEGCYNFATYTKHEGRSLPLEYRTKLFEEAAAGGISKALIWLGSIYGSHANNKLKSTECYINAALQGEAEGIKQIAESSLMVYDEYGFTYEDQNNLTFSKPSLSPIPDGEGSFAVLEVLGENNPQDLMNIAEHEDYARTDKLYYYYKAADLDHPEACFKVGDALSPLFGEYPKEAIYFFKKAACLGNIAALKKLQNNQKKFKLADQELANITILYLLKNFENEDFKLTDFEIGLLKKLDPQKSDLKPGQNFSFGIRLYALLRTSIRLQEDKGVMAKLKTIISPSKSDATIQQELKQLDVLAYKFLREAALSEDKKTSELAKQFILLHFLPSGKLDLNADVSPAIFFQPPNSTQAIKHAELLNQLFSAKDPVEFSKQFDSFHSWFKQEQKNIEKKEKKATDLTALSMFADTKQDTVVYDDDLKFLRFEFIKRLEDIPLLDREGLEKEKIEKVEHLLTPGIDIEIDKKYIDDLLAKLNDFIVGNRTIGRGIVEDYKKYKSRNESEHPHERPHSSS